MLAGQGGYTMLVYLLIQTYLKKGQKAQVILSKRELVDVRCNTAITLIAQ